MTTLKVLNGSALKHFLELRDWSAASIDSLNESELVTAVIGEVKKALPVNGQPDVNALSEAWEQVKKVRDKRIAHNEIAQPTNSTYSQMDLLLEFASQVVQLVGLAYLNTTFIKESDKPARSMLRLIRHIAPLYKDRQ